MRRSLTLFCLLCSFFVLLSLSAEAAEFTELCRTGTPQQVRQAIQKGAKANARDARGQLPLIAALENKAGLEIVHLLVESGASVNAKNASGLTALHVAVHRYNPEFAVELLRLKANVNATGGDIGSPLMAALLREPVDPQLVNLLIQTGGDVNYMDDRGLTPLIQAVAVSAPVDVLKMLLKNGASVDKTSPKIAGETALMIAAGYSPSAVVKLLLDAGASTKARNTSGKTAIDYAREAKKTENFNLITAKDRAPSAGTGAAKAEGTKLPSPVLVEVKPGTTAVSKDVPAVSGAEPAPEPKPTVTPSPVTPAPEAPRTPPVVVPQTPPQVATPEIPLPQRLPGNTEIPGAGRRPMMNAPSFSPSMLPGMGGGTLNYYLYLFLGCCLGCWAASLIVLRASLTKLEILICGTVTAISTAVLTHVWGVLGGILGILPFIVHTLIFWILCSLVNGLVFMILARHPLTGNKIDIKWGVLTAFVSLVFSQSMTAILFMTMVLFSLHQYLFAVLLLALALSPYFSFYASAGILLKKGPPMKELLTCVFVMGFAFWFFGIALSLLRPLLQPILEQVVMMLVQLPSLLAWIAGMGLLILILALVATPVVGRTIFNPFDGSRLTGGSAFGVAFLGALFFILMLRVLVLVVSSSLMPLLPTLMGL